MSRIYISSILKWLLKWRNNVRLSGAELSLVMRRDRASGKAEIEKAEG